jgi:RNA polymerase sigma-B factor
VVEDHMPYARHMQELTGAMHKAVDVLTTELGRPPTVPEPAERLGVETEEAVAGLDAAEAYRTASLDRLVGTDEDGASVGELIGDEDPGYELAVDHETLCGLVGKLGSGTSGSCCCASSAA